MAEESALIARRCQEAKETRKLSLDECGLRKFPDAVFFLLTDVQLEAVSLSRNQLKKIPTKLAEAFSNITSLDLSNNDLSSIPGSFSHFPNLTHLTLSHNVLTEFPPPMAALVTLEVASNRLYHATAVELEPFPALQQLDVSGNPLTEESKEYLTAQDRVHVVWEPS